MVVARPPVGNGGQVLIPLSSTDVAWSPLRRFLAAHQVPGREWVDPSDGAHVRVVDTVAGPVLVRVQWPDPAGPAPSGDVPPGGRPPVVGVADGLPADVSSQVAGVVHRWLGLDLDPGPAVAALSTDPLLGPLVAARPGLRIPGSVDGAETALFTVLGQQVSLAAARTFAGRLVRQWSTAIDPGPGGVEVAGPLDLARIAGAPAEEFRASLGVTGARARTLQALAGALADGLTVAPGSADERAAVRAGLLALPGIGPWTVEYLTLRCLRDPDGYPAGDLVLRRMLAAEPAPGPVPNPPGDLVKNAGISSSRRRVAPSRDRPDGATPAANAALPSERVVRLRAEPWRPWRGFALLHLWTAAVFV